jgi:hypothetical protein
MTHVPKGVIGTYSSFTLEGAWAEERSGLPPAPGGIPDLGFRLYNTKHADDFPAPSSRGSVKPADLTYPRSRTRYGMLTSDTWNEASLSYGGGPEALQKALTGRKAFNMTHGGRDMTKAEIAATFTSTAREAAISGVQMSATASAVAAKNAATVARTNFAPAAGGQGAVFTDKGKRITGVTGEVVKESADLRYDSVAQRSWLGKPDAGLSVTKAGVRARAPAPPPSLPSPHRTRTPTHARVRAHAPHLTHARARAPRHRPQKPPARAEVDWMSPKIGAGEGEVRSPPRASEGAMHGRFAAYAAPARCTTDVTATLGRPPPGRRVFLDDPISK